LTYFWERKYYDEDVNIVRKHRDMRIENINKRSCWGDHNYTKEGRPWNEDRLIEAKEVYKAVKGLKKGKAAGLSGLEGYMWKAVVEEVGLERVVGWFNKVLGGDIPQSWSRNKIVLVPKVERENVEAGEFRPITITECSYKIFGSVLKERLSVFSRRNGMDRVEQSGFVSGRQLEENIATVNMIREKEARRKGNVFIAAVDLAKAFDSIDRGYMINLLDRVGLDECWVGCIESIYDKEESELYWEEKKIGTIRRNRGIKQGCCASPLMFNMCMRMAVDRLNETWREEKINILMYADDALIFARSERELQEKVNVFKAECREMGLEINKDKSMAMTLVGKRENEGLLAGFENKDEVKYLGALIGEGGSFKSFLDKKMETIKRMVSYALYLIRGKMHRMIVGRAIWKGVIVPRVMFGLASVRVSEKFIRGLDLAQRNFYRGVMGVPRRVAEQFLEGEMGSSSFKDRVDRARIRLSKRMLDAWDVRRDMMVKCWGTTGTWMNDVRDSLDRFGVSGTEFEEDDIRDIEKRIKDKRKQWFQEALESRSSLRVYRMVWEKGLMLKDWGMESHDEILKQYWSGAVFYLVKKHLEIEGRCGICGEDWDRDHWLQSCWGRMVEKKMDER